MPPAGSFDDATDRLVRNVMLAGFAPALLAGVVLWFVHPVAGLAAAVLVAGSWAMLVRRRAANASSVVLSSVAASAPAAGEHPRLENLLESVCVVGGISEPVVRVLPDRTMNAMAVADGSGSTFVLTAGLLDGLGRVQLEGVLANLTGRVKDGSARYSTVVVALLGGSAMATRALRDGLGEQPSVRSDLTAVSLTKYPPGLIAAFGVMAEQGSAVAGAPSTTRSMWLAEPGPSSRAADDGVDVQPLDLRIAVLEEL